MLTWSRRALIAMESAIQMLQAWRVKSGRSLATLNLPEVDTSRLLSEEDLHSLVRIVESIVALGTIRTGRKCFFRAYVLTCMLRKRGWPVVLNIGLKIVGHSNPKGGHCWVTLNGELVTEKRSVRRDYPVGLSEPEEGVQYWVGE